MTVQPKADPPQAETGADPVSDTETSENRGAYESISPQVGKKRKKKKQREGCAS